MEPSRVGVKLGSRSRVYPAVLALGLVGALGALDGCGRRQGQPGDPPADQIVDVDITPDATLVTDAGEGVGVFVETYHDGSWHVFFACDTNISGYSCPFRGSITTSGELAGLSGETLEASDYVGQDDPRSASFDLEVSTDFDGLWFDSTQGMGVTLEVTLDGRPAPEFVFWMGGGALHTGAPSNPVQFLP